MAKRINDQETQNLGYLVAERVPSVEEYNNVRVAARLKRKNTEAASIGLANTLFGTCIETAGQTVGIGRVVGDGALYFEVVDIAVVPEHQGKGLGALIMESLMSRIREGARPGAFVSLVAGEGVSPFYERYGFTVRPPESPGMTMTI